MEPKAIDHIYGESSIKGYEGPYRTKLLYNPETEQTLISTFGFSGDSTIQFGEIPKAIFERDISEQLDKKSDIEYSPEERKPMPGDLIKTLWDDSLFEITHVSTGEKIFKGEKLVYSLVMKPYRYSHESSDAFDITYEQLNLDDFPDVNISKDKILPDQHMMENNIVKKEAAKNDNFDEIDPSVYGYFVEK